ncbi:hypothetical protein F511_21217 [Dorcoceras hygrometricum]|uniref:Uncharacterized protein n=1 Tax=Dorcoceras hygrometricum TaxID=472368 RepID=A0A2Z7CFC1_9LAMI|nr:hypothetical protein F511_21217 [Dorcoceras hygrometricum]
MTNGWFSKRRRTNLLKRRRILYQQLDFTQTTAFQESRAKARFDWFCHRPVTNSPNQLTRHPAACTRRADEIYADGFSSSRLVENNFPAERGGGGGGALGRRRRRRMRRGGEAAIASSTCVTLNGSGIQLAVGPQPLWLRNHNSGLAHRIMVKRLETSPHDPLCITDSAWKNQLVVVSVQYGPFNPYIPIRSTTIGESRVAIDPIAMHTSWRSNSDIASVTSIGYPRMSASGESSTTMHRLLHASGSHPIPTPYDPKTNQYKQDLGLIHSTNGNHLESPNEGSSIDHQVTIYLHAQNITMLSTNETLYFASQILVSSSDGLILILTAQSTRNSSEYTVTIRCVS